MARIEILEPREQAAHFGLYRTSTGGDQAIFVRRKVGDHTDYMHTKSRKLKIQRDNLALASHHYSQLTPSQKAITRHQIEEVEYQKSHGKTDIKLLQGRQLFISKEIHSLATTQKQLELPYELCIMLVNQSHQPLEGELWLRYLKASAWLDIGKEELATGSWLFSQVPRGEEAYRPYGEAEGYIDPQLPELQYMTEKQILPYHYHVLHLGEGYWSYSFYSSYWSLSHMLEAKVPMTSIHVRSSLTTFDFTGTLVVGIKEYSYPTPPVEFITKETYPISSSDPDPKLIITTLSGLSFNQGEKYYLVHQLLENNGNPWSGSIRYLET